MKKLIALLLLFGIVGCAVEEVKKVAYVSGNEEGTYEGEWKDGQPNGQGTWTAPRGSNYVGEWKDFERNGQGTMTYANGKKEVGEFKDGEYVGGLKDDKSVEKSLREQLSEARMKLLKGPTKNIELYEACSKDFQRYMQPFLDLRAERLKLGDQSAARDYYDNHLPLGNEMYLRCFRDGLRF